MTKILPFLSDGGVTREWHDHEDGTITVVERQDVSAILDRNKAMATHNDGYTPSREIRRAASIPNVLIHKWLVEEGWNAFDPACADKLKQKLNSSEYLYLRTAPGRL
jgi:hypothetical protein